MVDGDRVKENIKKFENKRHQYWLAIFKFTNDLKKARATRSRTMNTMHVDGYSAKIEYDEELDLFRGEILGLNCGADFYGENPKEVRAEFKKSLQVFLEVCKEKGIKPKRNFWGK